MKDLQFQHIFVAYDRPVLVDLTLTFPAGETSVLMGRSGIGKTTVFRLAAGLLKPDRGEIYGLPEGGAGVMFQEDRLFPYLTVLKNLRLCVPERTEQELICMMKEAGLEGCEEKYPQELSGGMRRRAALIRAVAPERELYLLDEPLNGLDEQTKEQAARWLRRRLLHKTAVVITHSTVEAELLGGKIMRLEEYNKGEREC